MHRRKAFLRIKDSMNEEKDKVKDLEEKHKNDVNVEKLIMKDMIDMIKQLTISIVVCNVENDGDEEIKLVNPKSKKWNKGFNKKQVEIYETILKKMNDTDWNEDKGYCKLIYDKKDKTLGFETNDSDDEEEKWEEMGGYGFIEDETDEKWILKVKDLKTGQTQIFDSRKAKENEFSVCVCGLGFKQIIIERGIDKVISDYTKLKKNKK